MTQRSPFPENLPVGRRVPVDLPPQSPPSFGIDANRVNVQTIPLDIARINERFEFGASNFIWVIDASSLTANLTMRLNSQQNSAIPFKQGQVIRGLTFSTAYITNLAQAGENLTFLIVREGAGLLSVENPSASAATVIFQKATVIDTIADVSCPTAATTQVAPTNNTRRRVVVQNLDPIAVIRAGDLNVAATRGFRLGAGEARDFLATEAVFVRNESGGAVNVSVFEEAD